MNLAELEGENLRSFGEYTSLLFEEKPYTNRELSLLANRLAHHLQKLGLKKGDCIFVLYPNAPEVLVAYAAGWKIGAAITPVIFLLQAEELKILLESAKPAAIITQSILLPKLSQALTDLHQNPLIIVGGEISEGEHILSLDRLLLKGDNSPIIEPCADEDVAVLLFTSGTTGTPKGVMLTHANLYQTAKNVREMRKRMGIEAENPVALSCLPLAHAYGLFLAVGGWLAKGKGIILPWFDPKKVLQLIEQHKVEAFPGVPTMFIQLLHYPDRKKFDVSSLQTCLCGAAPLPLAIKKEFEREFDAKIYQGYGLSEASVAVAGTPDDMPEEKEGSVGIPIDGVEVAIWDDLNQPLSAGEIGEIMVKGPGVMKGYYQMEEATKKAIENGYLHTGDLGYLDEDGYLYIVERKKDLIIRGGFNIFPKDIEQVLATHPKIMEAAVVGMPDEVYGEEVCAFFVSKIGETVTEEDLSTFLEGKLSKNKIPKKIIPVPFLPKNPLGKVLKKELRQRLSQREK